MREAININYEMIPDPLTDDDVVGFGTYRDTKLAAVPIEYFDWMVRHHLEYPRVQRSVRWILVIDYIRSHR